MAGGCHVTTAPRGRTFDLAPLLRDNAGRMLFNSYEFILGFLPLVFLGFYATAWVTRTGAAAWLGLASLFSFICYRVLGIPTIPAAFLVIALVEAVRTIVENSLRPAKPEGFAAPVVFSLEQGDAWASWYGSHSWIRLGPDEEVAEMMRDFLAQRELAKRLESGGPAILR